MIKVSKKPNKSYSAVNEIHELYESGLTFEEISNRYEIPVNNLKIIILNKLKTGTLVTFKPTIDKISHGRIVYFSSNTFSVVNPIYDSIIQIPYSNYIGLYGTVS